ncbi:MAG: hypothetical protein ACFCD0_25960 [Gemmataceae bacterium]
MAAKTLSPEELQAIIELAKGWGKIVVQRAFGEEGPGLDINLTQMEQIATTAAEGLLAGTLEQATTEQAQQLPSQHPCPGCGRLCSLQTDPRPVTAQGGTFLHQEPKGHCPTCRRDFFPSKAPVGP